MSHLWGSRRVTGFERSRVRIVEGNWTYGRGPRALPDAGDARHDVGPRCQDVAPSQEEACLCRRVGRSTCTSG